MKLSTFDYLLFFSWLTLGLVGLVAIYSATQGEMHIDTHLAGNFSRQVIHVLLGLALIMLMFFTTPQTYLNFTWLLYGVTIVFAVLTILFGVEVAGEKNWLNIFGFRLQISEFMKTAAILAVAAYLNTNRKAHAGEFSTIAIIVTILMIPVVFITIMGDTGTSLIYFFLIPFLLFWAGLPFGYTLIMIAPGILAYFTVVNWVVAIVLAVLIPLVVFVLEKKPILTFFAFIVSLMVVIGIQVALLEVLQPHQRSRVEAFVNPAADPQGAGWNVIQAKTAIGSGGLYGKGFMQGTQTQLRFLPEQQTDFIFCVISEEFGFLGAGFVLFLYLILISRMLFIARTHKHPFAQTVGYGFAVIFLVHIIINLGSAMALLPIIGVPLPLLSYGGSSFLNFSIMVGILMNFEMHERDFSIYT
jgi:rod shape determining protein RodA